MMLPVAILAGGRATRLYPMTLNLPKSLVPVAGRPFAVHQIELLARHGINRVVFCVGHLGERIADALGDGSRWGISLEYLADGPTPLGTGGAIRRACGRLGPSFLVLYGDSYLDCDYGAVVRAFVQSGRQGLMTVFRNEGVWDTSNVQFEDGRILAYDKQRRSSAMRHIDYGLNVFTREAFGSYAEDAAFDLSRVQQDLLARGDLAAYEVSERFYEIGSPEGLAETEQYLARGVSSRS